MKKCTLALLCSAALFSTAQAADLAPMKAPMYSPAPVSNWTGLYVGGNVGYGWGHVSLDGLIGEMNPSGVNGGGQIGYNWQVGQTVFGIEGDFQAADHKDNLSFSDPTVPIAASLDVKSDWFATVRGRLGYSFGQFMPYVTGGLAFTRAKANLDASSGGVSLATISADKTSTGYAIGAGIEYAISRNWSLKAEYMHLGFGTQTYNFDVSALGTPVGTIAADAKLNFDIARLGVNYRF